MRLGISIFPALPSTLFDEMRSGVEGLEGPMSVTEGAKIFARLNTSLRPRHMAKGYAEFIIQAFDAGAEHDEPFYAETKPPLIYGPLRGEL